MKQSALALLLAIATLSTATADDAIKAIMKDYHKPEDAICKKVGKGEATDEDLAILLKSYQTMCAITPAKGEKTVWIEKCQALIAAVKKVQAKDATGISDFKKAVDCKGCHTGFKGK